MLYQSWLQYSRRKGCDCSTCKEEWEEDVATLKDKKQKPETDDKRYERLSDEFMAPEYGELEGCCGVTEIHELPEDGVDADEKWWLKRFLLTHDFGNSYGKAAIQLITLKESQEKAIGSIIRAAGFKKKASGLNPKTNNNIYLYCKIVSPTKKGKAKANVKRRF